MCFGQRHGLFLSTRMKLPFNSFPLANADTTDRISHLGRALAAEGIDVEVSGADTPHSPHSSFASCLGIREPGCWLVLGNMSPIPRKYIRLPFCCEDSDSLQSPPYSVPLMLVRERSLLCCCPSVCPSC